MKRVRKAKRGEGKERGSGLKLQPHRSEGHLKLTAFIKGQSFTHAITMHWRSSTAPSLEDTNKVMNL